MSPYIVEFRRDSSSSPKELICNFEDLFDILYLFHCSPEVFDYRVNHRGCFCSDADFRWKLSKLVQKFEYSDPFQDS
jgi:hypothetical protein